jgi:hypothetical protein
MQSWSWKFRSYSPGSILAGSSSPILARMYFFHTKKSEGELESLRVWANFNIFWLYFFSWWY